MSVFWELLKPVTSTPRPRAALRDPPAMVAASSSVTSHLGHPSHLVPAPLCHRRALEGAAQGGGGDTVSGGL